MTDNPEERLRDFYRKQQRELAAIAKRMTPLTMISVNRVRNAQRKAAKVKRDSGQHPKFEKARKHREHRPTSPFKSWVGRNPINSSRREWRISEPVVYMKHPMRPQESKGANASSANASSRR